MQVQHSQAIVSGRHLSQTQIGFNRQLQGVFVGLASLISKDLSIEAIPQGVPHLKLKHVETFSIVNFCCCFCNQLESAFQAMLRDLILALAKFGLRQVVVQHRGLHVGIQATTANVHGLSMNIQALVHGFNVMHWGCIADDCIIGSGTIVATHLEHKVIASTMICFILLDANVVDDGETVNLLDTATGSFKDVSVMMIQSAIARRKQFAASFK
jgi:hypothetical protein